MSVRFSLTLVLALLPAAASQAQLKIGSEKLPPARAPVPARPGASGTAKSIIEERAGQIDALNKLKQARSQASGPVLSGLQTAAKQSNVVIDFDKSWKELTETRAKTAGNRLTAKEVALVKALQMQLKVDFNKTPFRDVLNYLAEKSGQAITISDATLDEAKYDNPVTLKASTPLSVRSILRRILGERGLTYAVKDGLLVVVTPEQARGMLSTRVYPVTQRCGPPPPSDSPLHQTNRNGLHLKRLIESMIDPDLWDADGGGAAVHYSWFNVSLTVRAPGELHLKLAAAGLGGK
jgi:hypothetical protein